MHAAKNITMHMSLEHTPWMQLRGCWAMTWRAHDLEQ
jgi:hypothetical protein